MGEETKICKGCGIEKVLSAFPRQSRDRNKRRGSCHTCKYKKSKASGYLEATKEKRREYHRNYHKNNPEVARYKANKNSDKINGRDTMSLEEYRGMVIECECHYCGQTSHIGVDRLDNELGHTVSNCVPCCEKCNFILGDLPVQAKDILAKGLREMQNDKMLEDWVIPTKRVKRK